MAQVLHCTITRYINSTREEDVRGEAEAFLSAIFESMKVQKVLRASVAWQAAEASHALLQDLVIQIEPIAIPELLARIGDQNLTMEICAGVRTFGINFNIEQQRHSTGATLYYRFGPLPVVELTVLYFADQQSPAEWAKMLLTTKAVAVVYTRTDWLRRERCYGAGDSRYLWWKRARLFREPTANMAAVQAGRVLREFCNRVWNEPKWGLAKLETTRCWPWSQKRFTRAFDQALVKQVGVEKLAEIFRPMGTTVEQWLET